jgi:hypothetical protein
VDPPYSTESEIFGGAMTVSFSKYLPWQCLVKLTGYEGPIMLSSSSIFYSFALICHSHYQLRVLPSAKCLLTARKEFRKVTEGNDRSITAFISWGGGQ